MARFTYLMNTIYLAGLLERCNSFSRLCTPYSAYLVVFYLFSRALFRVNRAKSPMRATGSINTTENYWLSIADSLGHGWIPRSQTLLGDRKWCHDIHAQGFRSTSCRGLLAYTICQDSARRRSIIIIIWRIDCSRIAW